MSQLFTKFDRTGTAPDHVYDMEQVALYTEGDSERRIAVWELDTCSETDPRTVRICLTRFDPDFCDLKTEASIIGKVLLWGEDCDGARCWLREDDEIARAFYDANSDLFKEKA